MFNQKLRNTMDLMELFPESMRAADDKLSARLAKVDKGPYWGGDIDQRALDRVREEWGITRPVYIERGEDHRVGIDGILWGQWSYDHDNPHYHKISILPDISLEVAEEILAHELTHARQLERDGYEEVARQNMDTQFKQMLFGIDAYYEAPHEVEAEEAAHTVAQDLGILRADRR